jgi:hypothetical protein
MKRTFATVVGLLCLAMPARADISGNDLYRSCENKNTVRECETYIAGLVNGMSTAQDTYVDLQKATKYWCIPDGAVTRQGTDIVRAYLHDHPAERHMPAGAIAFVAVSLAWPCPAK